MTDDKDPYLTHRIKIKDKNCQKAVDSQECYVHAFRMPQPDLCLVWAASAGHFNHNCRAITLTWQDIHGGLLSNT